MAENSGDNRLNETAKRVLVLLAVFAALSLVNTLSKISPFDRWLDIEIISHESGQRFGYQIKDQALLLVHKGKTLLGQAGDTPPPSPQASDPKPKKAAPKPPPTPADISHTHASGAEHAHPVPKPSSAKKGEKRGLFDRVWDWLAGVHQALHQREKVSDKSARESSSARGGRKGSNSRTDHAGTADDDSDPSHLDALRVYVSRDPTGQGLLITLDLEEASRVTVSVHDRYLKDIRVLKNGWLKAGRSSLNWDQRDELGHPVRPGIYEIKAVSERKTVRRFVRL